MTAFDSRPSPRVREKLLRRIGYVPADPWLARIYLFLVDCCTLLAVFCGLLGVGATGDGPDGFNLGMLILGFTACAWCVAVAVLTAVYWVLRPFFDGARY